jgi:hypothetical protein
VNAVRHPATWTGSWFRDPLERVLLVALGVVSACLLVVLVTRGDDGAAAAREACILATVEDARRFAAVLGDERPVQSSFAHRYCGPR